jgi:hypothetical protein
LVQKYEVHQTLGSLGIFLFFSFITCHILWACHCFKCFFS